MVPEMLLQPMESEDACQPRASWLVHHRQTVNHVMYLPKTSAEIHICNPDWRRRFSTRAEMKTNEGPSWGEGGGALESSSFVLHLFGFHFGSCREAPSRILLAPHLLSRLEKALLYGAGHLEAA
jgi:hypothetical protein